MRLAGRAIVAVSLVLTACGSESDSADSTPTTTTPSTESTAPAGDIVVFAAASLTDAFTEIADAFVAAHPGTEVTFSFGSSSDLVAQIDEGAPADVYASADIANMTKLTDAGNHGDEPRIFASNVLEIIVPAGNPRGIQTVEDLAADGVLYVTCAPEVPIGRYAAEVLDKAGVAVEPASFEENVKGIVTKVTEGEADAGIVYHTDVVAAGARATGVEIPPTLNVVAHYPIVLTKDAPNPGGGAAFVEFVISDAARQVLLAHGFLAP